MIFVCRKILEKRREQQEKINRDVVDLKKVFDTVDKQLLFVVLRRFGYPLVFLTVIRAQYSCSTTMVRVSGDMFEDFGVSMDMKQGCVLISILQ